MNRRRFLSWLGLAPLCVPAAAASLSTVVIGIDAGGLDGKIGMTLVADELHEFGVMSVAECRLLETRLYSMNEIWDRAKNYDPESAVPNCLAGDGI